MTIAVGDAIPDVTLKAVDGEVREVATGALFRGRDAVLFSVPGAFTPTCSSRHLPGYIAHFGEFRRRGIDVACMAVNDAHVMAAWARDQKVPPGLTMLADGNGAFASALGLVLDARAFGMGMRSRRFALYAEDGVVKVLNVEAPGELRVSTAEAMLAAIDQFKGTRTRD